MKSLLVMTLLASIACVSCSTLANRRDLYRPLKASKASAKTKTPAPATQPTTR